MSLDFYKWAKFGDGNRVKMILDDYYTKIGADVLVDLRDLYYEYHTEVYPLHIKYDWMNFGDKII